VSTISFASRRTFTGITGLTILGIETYVQNLFYGGGLVLSVALSQLVRNREAQDFG
jgi:ribose transport system permease protein